MGKGFGNGERVKSINSDLEENLILFYRVGRKGYIVYVKNVFYNFRAIWMVP
jgi:hypothetical protein